MAAAIRAPRRAIRPPPGPGDRAMPSIDPYRDASRRSEATAPGTNEAGTLHAEWSRLKSRYAALHEVSLDEGPESVRLKGRAPSQHLRQVALAVACRASGTKQVIDEVRVDKHPPRANVRDDPSGAL